MTKEMSAENHLDKEVPKWFAVYTSYKREKLVAKMLSQKGIENYLPLQKVVRRYNRKIRTQELPLINCYIFVRIIKGQYVPVLETEYVHKFTKIANNLLSIPDHEIETLKRIVGEEGLELSLEQERLNIGDQVEIIAGNLIGIQGRLVAEDGKNKVIVDLENVGYSLKMTIEASLLRKLSDGSESRTVVA